MEKALNGKFFIKGLVSIIVPVYNAEKYLYKCIESIVNQNYKDIEVTLIDDGSTDKSGKICDKFAASGEKIKVIHQKNSGPAAARNVGIANSKGEFIFFIDADDFITKNAIELLINCYNQTKVDLIIGNYKQLRKGVVENRKDINFPDNKLLTNKDVVEYSRQYLNKPNKYLLFAFSWGRLFKSSIVKENNVLFDVKLFTAEDVAFNYDYLNYVNRVYYLNKNIYSYLVYDNFSSASMTIGNSPIKLFGYREAFKKIANFLNKYLSKNEIRKEVGHAYVYLTIIQLVRMCGQICKDNKKLILELIHELVNDTKLRNNLKFYSPGKGESKIIPALIKLKLVLLIIWVCRYKAYKRYKY